MGRFSRYRVLIAPEVQAMTSATATALRAFDGRLITIGNTGRFDEWLNERAQNTLVGRTQDHFTTATAPGIVTSANTGQIVTTAPPQVQLSLRRKSAASYSVVVVNTAATPTGAFSVNVRPMPGMGTAGYVTAARLAKPGSPDVALNFQVLDVDTVRVNLPAGTDTLALLMLISEWSSGVEGFRLYP